MKYTYYAKSIEGKEKQGEVEARDQSELAHILREQGYMLISSKEKGGQGFFSVLAGSFETVPLIDKMMFSRNLSIMTSAGLSVTKALGILERQTKNQKFKKTISDVSENIKMGSSLHESMSKHPSVFSSLFVATTKAGEESGKLSESLLLIAEQLERDNNLRKKIKGALMYPAIIISAMVLIGILMLVYVVPTLVSTFKELGVELPTSTKVIIAASNFLTSNIILSFGIFLIIVFAIISLIKTKRGKDIINTVVLRLPVISDIVKKTNSARTTRTLASLISSGVDILEALSITHDVLQNEHYKHILGQAKIDIQKGKPMSESFKRAEKLYPLLVGEMIAVGEETGKLPNMLMRLAVFYEEEVDNATKNMTTIIEPILMVLMGGVVGFFAISMIKPMYSMLGGI